MGQHQANLKQQLKKISLSKDEVEQLIKTFTLLSNCQESTPVETCKIQSTDRWLQLFKNDQKFGKNMFEWMCKVASNLHSAELNLLGFFQCVEYLLKDQSNYSLSVFNGQEYQVQPIEIFFRLALEGQQYGQTNSETLMINKESALALINHIFNMTGQYKNDQGQKSLVDGIFDAKTQLSLSDLIRLIKQDIGYINRYVREYYACKFLERRTSIKMPVLQEESEIISDGDIPLFYYGEVQGFKACDGLYRLYSSSKQGTSINSISKSILGYDAPTLILIKHKDKKIEGQVPSNCVFGAYHSQQWKDSFSFQGDSQNFMFTLFPKFQLFFTYQGNGGQNYSYFNTKFVEKSNYPVGMGFGASNDYKKFRIWLDDMIDEKSYVSPDDSTYAIGYLINEKSALHISAIEIWGIGTQEHLQKQNQWRIEQQKEIERMRKVDKKALFDNQFNQEMFFGKLLEHKQQLREEISLESEQQSQNPSDQNQLNKQ